uniref:DUF8211 domain-containing protein n=1 Tax=Rhizophagus irregularis (strain DAOM 181602 / DAOM 197198 / MUCL 43194) TaxID=747089 RepID=U9UV64_RHIID
MYYKCLENLRPHPSHNPNIARKQQARFQLFKASSFEERLVQSKKHHFLFWKQQRINKPVQHLHYRKSPSLPLVHHYRFDTLIYSLTPSIPPYMGSIIYSSIIRERTLGVPDDLLPFIPDGSLIAKKSKKILVPGTTEYVVKLRQLKNAHVKAEIERNRESRRRAKASSSTSAINPISLSKDEITPWLRH